MVTYVHLPNFISKQYNFIIIIQIEDTNNQKAAKIKEIEGSYVYNDWHQEDILI